jgi:hypothetical protein
MDNVYIDSICPNLGSTQRKRILEIGHGNPGAIKVLAGVAMNYAPEVSGAIFWKLSEADVDPAQVWILYKDQMNEKLDKFVQFCLGHKAGQILKAAMALE